MPTDGKPRHYVLTTTGTDGDLYPFYELGLTLRARGHRVTLATHDHFEDRCRRHGLGFLSLVTTEETQALVDQEALWGPLILPFAFDQLDNALRVWRLQQGAWLPRRNRSAGAITRALSALVAGDPREQGRGVARIIREADGLLRTADLLD